MAVFAEYQRSVPQASPSLGQRLKDKERDQLKSTFAVQSSFVFNYYSCNGENKTFQDFNKEFENLTSVQKSYSVPDVDLATLLRKESKDLVLPRYSWFYNS